MAVTRPRYCGRCRKHIIAKKVAMRLYGIGTYTWDCPLCGYATQDRDQPAKYEGESST